MSTSKNNAAGLAALATCETILLALVEDGVVDRDKVQEMLEDAIEAHAAAASAAKDRPLHEKAARLIEELVISLNAARSGENP